MRRLVRTLLAFVVALAIAWIGVWFYAQARMQQGFAQWAATLRKNGWQVAYDNPARGRSPTVAQFSVADLALTGPAGRNGHQFSVELPSLRLWISPLDPLTLNTDLPATMTIADNGNPVASLAFGSSSVAASLDPLAVLYNQPRPWTQARFTARGVGVFGADGSFLIAHLDDISTRATHTRNAAPGQTEFTGALEIQGLAVSPLFTRLMQLPFGGRIDTITLKDSIGAPVPADLQTAVADAGSDPAARRAALAHLGHEYALGGGKAEFSLAVDIGPLDATATATLGFDAAAQPLGTADIEAEHLDQFLSAIASAYPRAVGGINAASQRLGPYITTDPQGGQSLSAKITFGNGTIQANGRQVGTLPPIDWAKLENPAPTPPPIP